jgi:sugar phosphate isomerase/epimerase
MTPLQQVLSDAVARGQSHIELAASAFRPIEEMEAIAESGLFVEVLTLTSHWPKDLRLAQQQLELWQREIDDAALLGAQVITLQVPTDAPAWSSEGLALLHQYASARMLRLIER